jgi:uncharacterized protein (DUF4415 family)
MQGKKASTARFSGKALARTRSRSDWSRVDATTAAEVKAQIAEDKDDWLTDADAVLVRGVPSEPSKERVNIRLDRDIVDFFRANGPGYQTRINAVLKVFVRRTRPTAPGGRSRAR